MSNKYVNRKKLLDKIKQLPEGSLIIMAAFGTAHYWGRKFQALGYQVLFWSNPIGRLILRQYGQ